MWEVIRGHSTAAVPWERTGTHCKGGPVGHRTDLDGCEKSRPHRNSIPRPSGPQQVAIPTTLCFLLTNYKPKIHRNQDEY